MLKTDLERLWGEAKTASHSISKSFKTFKKANAFKDKSNMFQNLWREVSGRINRLK